MLTAATTISGVGADEVRPAVRDHGIGILRELVVAGALDFDQFESAVAGLLAARTDAELAAVVQALPSPVRITPPERRLSEPLRLRGGFGPLRLAGRWQVAAETHVSVELGSVTIDLTDAEFDESVVDLHVYTGWGRVTIVVPPGVGVQPRQTRGTVRSRLGPPVPGFPLVRLDVTTNIGTVRLHDAADQPWRRSRRGQRRGLRRGPASLPSSR